MFPIWINSWINNFAYSWINSNHNHEIVTLTHKRKFFLSYQDLNHSPLELKAIVLPRSYADPLNINLVKD